MGPVWRLPILASTLFSSTLHPDLHYFQKNRILSSDWLPGIFYIHNGDDKMAAMAFERIRGYSSYILDALQRHPLLVSVFFLLQAADIASTNLALRAGLQEGNPIPAYVLSTSGELGLHTWKVVTVIMFLIIVCLLEPRFRHAWQAVRCVNIIMLGVVWSNAARII
jgi:hypothetical protein